MCAEVAKLKIIPNFFSFFFFFCFIRLMLQAQQLRFVNLKILAPKSFITGQRLLVSKHFLLFWALLPLDGGTALTKDQSGQSASAQAWAPQSVNSADFLSDFYFLPGN